MALTGTLADAAGTEGVSPVAVGYRLEGVRVVDDEGGTVQLADPAPVEVQARLEEGDDNRCETPASHNPPSLVPPVPGTHQAVGVLGAGAAGGTLLVAAVRRLRALAAWAAVADAVGYLGGGGGKEGHGGERGPRWWFPTPPGDVGVPKMRSWGGRWVPRAGSWGGGALWWGFGYQAGTVGQGSGGESGDPQGRDLGV